MKVLRLTLKKKWFDMILSGEKKEEYREIKPYWAKRLVGIWGFVGEGSGLFPSTEETFMSSFHVNGFKQFGAIRFTNGCQKNDPSFVIECKGIEIGKAVPEWSDNWPGDVFVIKLGNIV